MLPTSNVYLELDIDNKRGRVIDDSDYTTTDINVAQANAKGLGIVTVNNTAVFNGSLTSNPLVNLAVSSIGQWFNLPLDSNGNVLNGTYSFTYSLNFSGSGSVDGVTTPNAAVLEFSNVGQFLQAGDSIVFTGNTQTANNGTFTISTVTPDEGDDQTALTFTQTTLVNEVTPTGTYSVNVTRANFGGDTYTFNGCDFVKPCVNTTFNCDSTQFGTITFQDTTDLKGQVVSTRTLIGYYPNGLNPAPTTPSVTTGDPSLTFTELAVGVWTYSLTLAMSVTQTDGLVYTYTVVSSDTVTVDCIGSLCSLTPCLESLKDTFITNYYKGTGANLIPLVTAVNQLIELATQYQACGDSEAYTATVKELEKLLNESGECDCGCGCSEENTPYWVNNAGFESQNLLDQLLADVTSIQSSQVTNIFTGRNFYGLATGYPHNALNFSNLSEITIPSGLLDFPTVNNAYGKKLIEIDIVAETQSTGAETAVTLITNPSVPVELFASTFSQGTSGLARQTTKLILVIQKHNDNFRLWALSNNTIQNDSGTTLLSENNFTLDSLTTSDDIVLDLTPQASGAAAKTTYTHVSIVGKTSLI